MFIFKINLKTLIMKKLIILLLLLLFAIPVFTQIDQNKQNQQVKYTKIDYIQKKTNPLFGGKSAFIEFNLISLENLLNDSILYGVEVNLNTVKSKVIGSSVALSNLSSLWGSSVGVTTKRIKEEGYNFLNYNDLKTIRNFMDKAISMRGGRVNKYTIYRLTLSDKIQIGFKFDPEAGSASAKIPQKLEFIITVENATYVTSYQEGIEIMKKLNEFQKQLKKLNNS
jgi:hypothetical protein